jgi:hypothetical protein
MISVRGAFKMLTTYKKTLLNGKHAAGRPMFAGLAISLRSLKKYLGHSETFPHYIHLDITRACNKDCTFCPAATSHIPATDPEAHMKLSLAKKIIDQMIAGCKLPPFIHFGVSGEPLLYPHLTKLLSYKSNEYHSLLTTNGELLGEWLYQSPETILTLDTITISMHDPEQIPHQQTNIDSIREARQGDTPVINTRWFMRIPPPDDFLPDSFFYDNILFPGDRARELQKTNASCHHPMWNPAVNVDGQLKACCSDHNNVTAVGNVKSGIGSLWPKLYRQDHAFCRRCV